MEGFNIDVMRNHVFTAEYDSLSGKSFVLLWNGGTKSCGQRFMVRYDG
jgi:hypothetical protein